MMESLQPKNNQDPTPNKPRKIWRSYLENTSLIVLAIAGGLVFIFVLSWIKAYKIPTGSMESTLLQGDHIIAVKFSADEKPERGDVIIFPFPTKREKKFVKRVVGLPGETLEIRQQQVFINSLALHEPHALHTLPPQSESTSLRDNFGPFLIPNGQVFVLGDNRENSADSRIFGPVSVEDISRKVKWIYWSWNSEENAVRWERIGTSIE